MSKFSFCKVMDKNLPLIVILGGTGTGKSKLAIEVAKKLGSEIISADSMQVYKGLDILTNKVTPEERAEVPHHLLDFVSPLNNFTVYNFRDNCLPIVDQLFKAGKPPVIVGGTNYYIESVLWHTLVDVNINKDFEDKRDDTILKVCEKLGIEPDSKSLKRKSDELNILPIAKHQKFINTPHELSTLMNYCIKFLRLIKDDFINEDCNVEVIDLLNCVVDVKSVEEIEGTVKILKEKLQECKQYSDKSESLIDTLKFCLTFKQHIYSVLSELDGDFLENEKNLSIEEILQSNKKDDINFSLLMIRDNVQKFYDLVANYIPDNVCNLESQSGNLSSLQSPQLHDLLKKVDPERAAFLHPNNDRKILRSLEIWLVTGRKHSDFIRDQQSVGSALGGPLRFKNSFIFWLTANPDVLNKRLDDRVYQMLDRGLVKELLDFYAEYQPKEEDFTKGIFQSIGFKHFYEYLLLNDEEKFNDVGKKKLNDGIESLKLVTRRYVKYQNKWVKNRFLRCPDREVPPVYKLDTSNIERWDELVLNPALDVIMSTIEGKTCAVKPLPKEADVTKDEIISMKSGEYFCKDCQRTFIGLLQFNMHNQSNRHKKVVTKNKKEAGILIDRPNSNVDNVDSAGTTLC